MDEHAFVRSFVDTAGYFSCVGYVEMLSCVGKIASVKLEGKEVRNM